MEMKFKIVLIVAALGIFTVKYFHDFEELTDATVGQAAITKTCWDRHGYDVVSRWSCRSAFNHIGDMPLAMTCAFKSEADVCKNLKQISKENNQ
jgi:hypothetical protein